jgi:DNA-binding transcriptional MerR regulator
MLPAQLGRLTQLSTDTLRHYERVGRQCVKAPRDGKKLALSVLADSILT